MTGFTSGANTDWRVIRWDGIEAGVYDTKAEADQAAIWWTGSRVVGPEFDNDNPILVAFREYAALDNFGHVSHLIVHDVRQHLDIHGLHVYEGRDLIAAAYRDSTDEQVEHAKRVLDKLWQLTYPDIPYEEPAPEENFWDDRTTAHLPGKNEADAEMIVRRTAVAEMIVPGRRYAVVAEADTLMLRCTEHEWSLCAVEAGDPLLVLVGVAIEHEVKNHS